MSVNLAIFFAHQPFGAGAWIERVITPDCQSVTHFRRFMLWKLATILAVPLLQRLASLWQCPCVYITGLSLDWRSLRQRRCHKNFKHSGPKKCAAGFAKERKRLPSVRHELGGFYLVRIKLSCFEFMRFDCMLWRTGINIF